VASQDALQLLLVALELLPNGASEAALQGPGLDDELLASGVQQPLERRQARRRGSGLDRATADCEVPARRASATCDRPAASRAERRRVAASMLATLYRFRYGSAAINTKATHGTAAVIYGLAAARAA
jgi:hypothetical protein